LRVRGIVGERDGEELVGLRHGELGRGDGKNKGEKLYTNARLDFQMALFSGRFDWIDTLYVRRWTG
jgi:hypothetical protein